MSEAPQDNAPQVETPPETMLAPQGDVTPAEGEWMLTTDLKGSGETPEWFKGDKYKTVQAQAEAYNALESKLGGFTGSPDDYTVNMPEGLEVEFDEGMLTEAKDMFKEMGMSQDGFDKAMAWYVGSLTDSPEAQAQAMEARVVEVLGPNHEQVIQQASTALQNMMGVDQYKEIAPLVNSPEAIKLVMSMVTATAPKVPPIDGGSNPDGYTKSGLDAMRNERISDGPYKGQLRHHKDPAFRAEINAYSTALHGSD